MDHSRRNPDRADPLRSLRKALARGAFQVLQPHLRGGAQPPHCQDEGRAERSASKNCDPNDLTHRCEHCGEPVPAGSRSSRKYCSQRCRDASATHLEALARIEENMKRKCLHCGGPMPADCRSDMDYCSKTCTGKAHRLRIMARAEAKTCAHCRKSFHPCKPDRKFCSQQCSASAQKRREAISCQQCGEPLLSAELYCQVLFAVLFGKGRSFIRQAALLPAQADSPQAGSGIRWNAPPPPLSGAPHTDPN